MLIQISDPQMQWPWKLGPSSHGWACYDASKVTCFYDNHLSLNNEPLKGSQWELFSELSPPFTWTIQALKSWCPTRKDMKVLNTNLFMNLDHWSLEMDMICLEIWRNLTFYVPTMVSETSYLFQTPKVVHLPGHLESSSVFCFDKVPGQAFPFLGNSKYYC